MSVLGDDTVGSVMTRHVITVRMDDPLEKVRELFDRHRFHHVIVVDGGVPVGVISDRDLLRNVSPFLGTLAERTQDLTSLRKKAHQVMSRDLCTVRPETTIRDAIDLMVHRRISCLPVLDHRGSCTGIITLRDMMLWALRTIAAPGPRPPRAA